MSHLAAIKDRKVILYDGICNFCNSSVNFIIKRDKKDKFLYAPLQGQIGQEILQKNHMPLDNYDSFILWKEGKVYKKSTAALYVMKELGGLWPILFIFIIIPRFIRDFFYNILAKNRYKWFGKQDSCLMPTQEIREKFLL